MHTIVEGRSKAAHRRTDDTYRTSQGEVGSHEANCGVGRRYEVTHGDEVTHPRLVVASRLPREE